ncbi:MAG: sodium:calcium antiporter [Chloroflexota bacterium]|nr:sodium:calcium antiporter [Chloroflexota bacterium]
MFWVWAQFLICVSFILVFGSRLSRYGDVIGEKTGLSGIWIGLLLLAVVTSLPELITGISAVTIVGAPDLALGTAFGSNTFNLLIIALADVLYRKASLFSVASKANRALGLWGIVLIAVAGAAIPLSTVWSGAIGWVSAFSLLLVLLYLWGSRRIARSEAKSASDEQQALRYQGVSTRRAYLGFAVAALVVIGAGTWLAIIGDQIATITGWGETFVGSLLLAAATSLPELVVSVVALRLGALDMAIANVLGSNMFNMGIVIAGDDIFYRPGPIFAAVSMEHLIAVAIAIVMTLVVLAGFSFRFGQRSSLKISWHSLAIIAIYIAGAYLMFTMRAPL